MGTPFRRTFPAFPAALLLAAALGFSLPAGAQEPDPFTGEIRGLKLGLKADAMPAGLARFACGKDGGPPTKPLKAWTDFKECGKDAMGFFEVAFEYDNVGNHLADLFFEEVGEQLWLDKYTGTKLAGHPVVMSVLFDDAGVVQGFRSVTDSRARLEQRRISNMLAVVVRNHYDPLNWVCETLPLERGQQPIGNSYIKQRCETVYRNDRRMVVWRNFYRKPGQTGVTMLGDFADGEWESSTRWEVWALSVPLPAPAAPVVPTTRTTATP